MARTKRSVMAAMGGAVGGLSRAAPGLRGGVAGVRRPRVQRSVQEQLAFAKGKLAGMRRRGGFRRFRRFRRRRSFRRRY